MATLDQKLDRALPASIEAEKTILGSILLDNHSCNEAAETLLPDDFYLDGHRKIYTAMLALNETGRPIDLITLTEELYRKKEVESVGGAAYISSLIDGVPHLPSIGQYITIVKDKALLRGLVQAANLAIAEALEQADPAEEILDRAETQIFGLADRRIRQGFATIPQIVQQNFGTIDKLIDRGHRITGLETHFYDFDQLTSGLQRKDLVIVAARPSMGKTALAMNIAENAAVMEKRVVAIFSLEMSKESLLQRMLCSQARVDSHRLRTGFTSREDKSKLLAALDALGQAPIFIDDTPGISLTELRAKSRRLMQTQGRLDLIVVDYLQLISGSPVGGRRFENRTQEVSAISRGLKALAKELNVPVMALSQLSRAPETRGNASRPQLSDLRESGAIEQDADLVAFLYREEYYKPDDPELEGKAELIIAKQRNGPVDTIRLAFLKNCTRFDNLAGSGGGNQY